MVVLVVLDVIVVFVTLVTVEELLEDVDDELLEVAVVDDVDVVVVDDVDVVLVVFTCSQVQASVQKPHVPPTKTPPGWLPGSHCSSPSRMSLPQVAGRSVKPRTLRRSRTRCPIMRPVIDTAVPRMAESGAQTSAFICEPRVSPTGPVAKT
jgi:hypothetical protein